MSADIAAVVTQEAKVEPGQLIGGNAGTEAQYREQDLLVCCGHDHVIARAPAKRLDQPAQLRPVDRPVTDNGIRGQPPGLPERARFRAERRAAPDQPFGAVGERVCHLARQPERPQTAPGRVATPRRQLFRAGARQIGQGPSKPGDHLGAADGGPAGPAAIDNGIALLGRQHCGEGSQLLPEMAPEITCTGIDKEHPSHDQHPPPRAPAGSASPCSVLTARRDLCYDVRTSRNWRRSLPWLRLDPGSVGSRWSAHLE
jgi:hypothetical protein